MKEIERVCNALETTNKESLKCLTSYVLSMDGDTRNLFHYGAYLGGARMLPDGSFKAILGYPATVTDQRALNTLWRHYKTGRRVHYKGDKVLIYKVEEE